MNTYHKICTKCKITKPTTEFNKSKEKKDGHMSHCKSCRKEHYQDNKEDILEQKKEYYQDNRTDILEQKKEYSKNNKEQISARQKKYYTDNKKYIVERNLKYKKKRLSSDPLFKLRNDIGSLIRKSIKRGGFAKRSKTHKILGCSFDEFKIHIEKQFTEGMSWDNHGEWHFDHITPVSWAKTEEEIISLNNYINFQPLWAEDNKRKGNKFSG
jgi:hypothetical protein